MYLRSELHLLINFLFSWTTNEKKDSVSGTHSALHSDSYVEEEKNKIYGLLLFYYQNCLFVFCSLTYVCDQMMTNNE